MPCSAAHTRLRQVWFYFKENKTLNIAPNYLGMNRRWKTDSFYDFYDFYD